MNNTKRQTPATSSIATIGELLTIEQTADVLGLHANTIRNLIRRGDLKAVRIGARIIRVNATDVAAILAPVVAGEYGLWNK